MSIHRFQELGRGYLWAVLASHSFPSSLLCGSGGQFTCPSPLLDCGRLELRSLCHDLATEQQKQSLIPHAKLLVYIQDIC